MLGVDGGKEFTDVQKWRHRIKHYKEGENTKKY